MACRSHMQVDQIYALSQQSAMSNTSVDFKKLEHVLAELKPDERVLVSFPGRSNGA